MDLLSSIAGATLVWAGTATILSVRRTLDSLADRYPVRNTHLRSRVAVGKRPAASRLTPDDAL